MRGFLSECDQRLAGSPLVNHGSLREESVLRCAKCNVILIKGGKNQVNWNPSNWLCNSCQQIWTEYFYKMKLDESLNEGKTEMIDKVWQGFLNYNPSSRFSLGG